MSRAGDRLRGWVPRWWRGEGGRWGRVMDHALAPAEHLFRGASALRNAAYDRGWLASVRPPIPTVSVGNIGVGGAGKTPIAAWLAATLAARGRRPAIVMRGYGADEAEVHRELNPRVPVFRAPRRGEGVAAAARAGCDVAVLDDAFQHRAVARDLDIVLVAAESWSPVRRLLPRGPWREPVASLSRADLVIVTRKTASREAAEAVAAETGIAAAAVAIAHLAPHGLRAMHGESLPLDWLRDRRVLAVASLADPRPFAGQLAGLGAEVELAAYPDHHDFTPADVVEIAGRAGDRPLVCTRKEEVKLRPLLERGRRLEAGVFVLEQRVLVERGGTAVEDALRRLLS